MKEYQIEGNDLVTILTQQRNAAMDEIARQAAIIRIMERKLEAFPTQDVLSFPTRQEN